MPLGGFNAHIGSPEFRSIPGPWANPAPRNATSYPSRLICTTEPGCNGHLVPSQANTHKFFHDPHGKLHICRTLFWTNGVISKTILDTRVCRITGKHANRPRARCLKTSIQVNTQATQLSITTSKLQLTKDKNKRAVPRRDGTSLARKEERSQRPRVHDAASTYHIPSTLHEHIPLTRVVPERRQFTCLFYCCLNLRHFPFSFQIETSHHNQGQGYHMTLFLFLLQLWQRFRLKQVATREVRN